MNTNLRLWDNLNLYSNCKIHSVLFINYFFEKIKPKPYNEALNTLLKQ